MKAAKTGPELVALFEGRWAIVINGYVTYCGPEKECRKRLAILSRPSRAGD